MSYFDKSKLASPFYLCQRGAAEQSSVLPSCHTEVLQKDSHCSMSAAVTSSRACVGDPASRMANSAAAAVATTVVAVNLVMAARGRHTRYKYLAVFVAQQPVGHKLHT